MKRWRRRLAGIVVGLSLGYVVAGWWTALPATAAQTEAHHDAPAASHPDHSEHSKDAHAATLLSPEGEHLAFVSPVLLTAAGLFVAAVVLGVPALRFRGELPPDPADAHHDDHAHDHAHQAHH